MKIKFVATAKGRDWKVGEVRDFKGANEESYARKYIDRGWAEEASAVIPATKPANEAKPDSTGGNAGNQQQGAAPQK